jgi:ribosome-binding protein aMBF1 (putative translation factor)
MSHQDWNPVILRNPNAAKKNINVQTETVKRYTGNKMVKDVDIAEGKEIKYVCSKLRKAFEEARTHLVDPQTKKCYTRDSIAKRLNVSGKDITMLETGKLTEKESKQIILKLERVFKVKILESNK